MTDSESSKAPRKRKAAAPQAGHKAATSKSAASAGGPKAAPKPRATAPNAAPPPAESKAPTSLGAQPDEAPIPPRNRHERRSAGKKRPGQAPFKWPPIGPERP